MFDPDVMSFKENEYGGKRVMNNSGVSFLCSTQLVPRDLSFWLPYRYRSIYLYTLP